MKEENKLHNTFIKDRRLYKQFGKYQIAWKIKQRIERNIPVEVLNELVNKTKEGHLKNVTQNSRMLISRG